MLYLKDVMVQSKIKMIHSISISQLTTLIKSPAAMVDVLATVNIATLADTYRPLTCNEVAITQPAWAPLQAMENWSEAMFQLLLMP